MIPIRPPLAMVLGLLLPGAGHLYAGWPRRAVLFAALLPAVLIALCLAAATGVLPVAAFVPSILVVPAVLQIAAAIDAGRKARSPVLAPHRISNRAVVVGFALASLAVTLFTCVALEQTTLSARRMSSATMTPSLLVGDYVVLRRPAFMGPLAPGDVLEFRFPRDPRFTYLQRVVGLPGQSIELAAGTAPRIDGQASRWTVGEPARWRAADCTLQEGTRVEETLGEVTHGVLLASEASPAVQRELSDDELFVVNDNRGYRTDSRKWGPLERSAVSGQVLGIGFSWDPCAGRARLERVGALTR